MGLFDFFKKIIKKNIEEPKVEQEKIAFFEIGDWIERKGNEIEIREKEIVVLVQGKIKVFENELREKIKVVENFDVESKKVEDQIKFIVNEGRKKYIESLKDFVEKLEKLEIENLEKFIDVVNKIFLDFNKSSHMSYERTTVLIGKEMKEIKESLKLFSRNLIKVFDENKEIVDSSKTISLIKLKSNYVTKSESILEKINETVNDLDEKIIEEEEKEKNILEEIEIIKESDEYKENLERREKIKLSDEELKKDLLSLKQLIDFKGLANFFHIFKDQMNIVKAHRENFQTSFRKDDGESITNLLDKSNLNNETISGKIKEVNDKKEEMIKLKQEIKKDKTEELSSEKTKTILEIENLKNEKIREEKRYAKLKEGKENLVKEVKEKIKEMGVEVD
jgi:hypothetical protein